MKLSIAELKNPKLNIHIIGAAAVEGSAIARFLSEIGAPNVVLHDFCKQDEFQKRFLTFHSGVQNRGKLWQMMKKLTYIFHFADTYLEGIENADLIFLPQAWYKYDFNYPKLGQIVEAKKIATTNMIDLYLQLFPGQTIGVTGTHGKTTVMRLLGHILKEAQETVFVSGNDRHSAQVLELLAKPATLHANDILVLEISNRHLKQSLEKSPHIAVITNIYPNHLDEHESIDEYREVKKSIAAKQSQGDYLVLGPGDEPLREWGIARSEEQGKTIFAGKDLSTVETKFTLPGTLPGAHNHVNVLIAYEVCKLLEISEKQFQNGLDTFLGVEKRLEKTYDDGQLVVINDLAATAPEATKTALLSFPNQKVVLIMGGDDKNIPATAWQDLLEAAKAATVIVLPGTVRERLQTLKANMIVVENFADALEEVKRCIKNTPTLVLISPAGEGFYTKYLQGINLKKVLNSKFKVQS